jgi:hypothetical protein
MHLFLLGPFLVFQRFQLTKCHTILEKTTLPEGTNFDIPTYFSYTYLFQI